MQNGMKKDYSWASSAKEYAEIYADLRRARLDLRVVRLSPREGLRNAR